jgi:hypothetical protein
MRLQLCEAITLLAFYQRRPYISPTDSEKPEDVTSLVWPLTENRCHHSIISFSVSTCYFFLNFVLLSMDRLCGLVVRVPGYRSRGPGFIPGATTFSEK